jgi:hypothetical protein
MERENGGYGENRKRTEETGAVDDWRLTAGCGW